MNKTAIGNKRLAASGSLSASFSPIACCEVPIAASPVATYCTVTFPLTSVTNLGLAESVLIGVDRLDLGCVPGVSAPWILGGRAGHCSFKGDTCIQ